MSSEKSAFTTSTELDEQDRRLIRAYLETGIPVDALAYTDAFDHLADRLNKAGDNRPKTELFRRLLALRKSGRLPRLVGLEAADESGG